MEHHEDEEGVRTSVFVLAHDKSSYSSMQELVKAHRIEGSDVWLRECLPPSEFGKKNFKTSPVDKSMQV